VPTLTLAATVVNRTGRTGKISRNVLGVFKRGENLPQNGILHFVFNLYSQSSKIVLQS